ncbi:hypothetical protein [Mumia sp. DW29H23]|uniref:hypothetical protein n=1 Tax=Mumia sp. DW29H23 TaxID=3421241 RepID=UPI003D695B1C
MCMNVTSARSAPSSPATLEHLAEVVRLRRVRDRIARDYALPLDVEALARGAGISARVLSQQFALVYGASPYAYVTALRAARPTQPAAPRLFATAGAD